MPGKAFEGDIADEAFDGDIADDAFEGDIADDIADDAFEGDIADDALEGDIADDALEGDSPDEAFDDGVPGLIDTFVGPLGGVPRRGGLGARASLSLVCPAHVSSTGGGGGSAGALSRITFVDVRSGTPSLSSTRGAVTSGSRRDDDASCTANGDVMSMVADVLGSTRVADESN
jgi:hypothetical protein